MNYFLVGFGAFVFCALGAEINYLSARVDKLESIASKTVRRTGQYRAVIVPCTPATAESTCAAAIEVYQ